MILLLLGLAFVGFGIFAASKGCSGRLFIALGVGTVIAASAFASWSIEPSSESWLEGGEAGTGTEIALWGLTLGAVLVVLGFVVGFVRVWEGLVRKRRTEPEVEKSRLEQLGEGDRAHEQTQEQDEP